MILTHGLDAVEIDRFAHWHQYSNSILSRVFSTEEIEYCLKTPIKSAERFAAKFAAKEAIYKALCINMPFLEFCKTIKVLNNTETGAPIICSQYIDPHKALLSITHTKNLAIASIIIIK